jgi:predicted N-acetyltransferase YhbS
VSHPAEIDGVSAPADAVDAISIVPIADVSDAAVEALLDHAFGPDRHGRTAYRLRAGTCAIPALSFAALDVAGALVGTIQSWPVRIGDDPLVMVGPVAVEPAVQRGGIGRALVQATLDAADAGGSPPQVMIGDPEYYGRFFGFSADATGEWIVDGPVERHRLLARARPGQALPAAGEILPRI